MVTTRTDATMPSPLTVKGLVVLGNVEHLAEDGGQSLEHRHGYHARPNRRLRFTYSSHAAHRSRRS